ncbi:MAG TPA: PhaM family polyhydroxyalkanoate granule multifunctional regulatory protein [Caldimonas sp.]|nr:PhaM family polyhydroxyalkanoate granule multifunctional regulatory protein [Caldimonas sp.]
MSDANGFGKLVPGFEFLQNLARNAGAAMPGIGQWVAPTLDPAELDKRIGELRTVQFWLEQNARMLATTIQALEVQRMTLSTLKTMNVRMGDLKEAMTLKPPAAPAGSSTKAASSKERSAGQPATAVDPMQWWGALTNQFTQLATSALKDTAADAAKAAAGSMLKQSMDAAAATFRQATAAPGRVAGAMDAAVGKSAKAARGAKPATKRRTRAAKP